MTLSLEIYTFPSFDNVMEKLKAVNASPDLEVFYAFIANKVAGTQQRPHHIADLFTFSLADVLKSGLSAALLPTIRLFTPWWVASLVSDSTVFHIETRDYINIAFRANVSQVASFPATEDMTPDNQVYAWTRRIQEIFFEEVQKAPAKLALDMRPCPPQINSLLGQTRSGIAVITSVWDQLPEIIINRWGMWRILESSSYTGSMLSVSTPFLARLGAIHLGYIDHYTQLWGVTVVDDIPLPFPQLRLRRDEMIPDIVAGAKWRQLTQDYERKKGGNS